VRGNLGSLRAVHDTQIDKDGRGKRKNDGKPYLQGCDAGGKQLDPGHCWSPTELNEGQLAPKSLKKISQGCRGYANFTKGFSHPRARRPGMYLASSRHRGRLRGAGELCRLAIKRLECGQWAAA
jgi:hypothetical protein